MSRWARSWPFAAAAAAVPWQVVARKLVVNGRDGRPLARDGGAGGGAGAGHLQAQRRLVGLVNAAVAVGSASAALIPRRLVASGSPWRRWWLRQLRLGERGVRRATGTDADGVDAGVDGGVGGGRGADEGDYLASASGHCYSSAVSSESGCCCCG